jgi:hypothetical protein
MNLSLVTRTMPSTFTAAVAGGVLLLSPLAEAGKAVVTAEGGSQAIFEYRDDMLRIGNDQNNSYMVMREGTMYVVSLEGEQPMVFNASSMIKGMAQNTLQVAPSTLTSEFVSIKDTGRDETVAGIKGDVYEVTIREDGKERTDEIVLSKDKRAREFRDALFAMSHGRRGHRRQGGRRAGTGHAGEADGHERRRAALRRPDAGVIDHR